MTLVEDQITLICPTYERHSHVLKSIKYWRRSPFNVIFVDGSELPLPSCTLPDSLNKTVYHHCPLPLHERLLGVFARISTPYVLMLNDDERYDFNFLISSIRFLNDHPDFVACTASSVLISSFPFPRVVSDCYTSSLRSMVLESDDAIERITSLMSNYVPSHYFSVCRTIPLVQSYRFIYQSLPHDIYALDELALEFLLCAYGKNMVSNSLYWMRNSDNRPVRNTGDCFMSTKARFADLYFSDSAKYFAIIEDVSKQSGIERSNVEAAFFAYIKARGNKKLVMSLKPNINIHIPDIFSSLNRFCVKTTCAFLDRLLFVNGFVLVFFSPAVRGVMGHRISLMILRMLGIDCNPKVLRRMLSSYH